MTLNAQMNMYLCYHYVPLLLLLLCYPNFGRKFKFEMQNAKCKMQNAKCKMQNANANGKCNRLSVKPFIVIYCIVLYYILYVLYLDGLGPYGGGDRLPPEPAGVVDGQPDGRHLARHPEYRHVKRLLRVAPLVEARDHDGVEAAL